MHNNVESIISNIFNDRVVSRQMPKIVSIPEAVASSSFVGHPRTLLRAVFLLDENLSTMKKRKTSEKRSYRNK